MNIQEVGIAGNQSREMSKGSLHRDVDEIINLQNLFHISALKFS